MPSFPPPVLFAPLARAYLCCNILSSFFLLGQPTHSGIIGGWPGGPYGDDSTAQNEAGHELMEATCALYGLIHARYVLTTAGLEAMYAKYTLQVGVVILRDSAGVPSLSAATG